MYALPGSLDPIFTGHYCRGGKILNRLPFTDKWPLSVIPVLKTRNIFSSFLKKIIFYNYEF